MEIKKGIARIADFLIDRLLETIGLLIAIASILLLTCLLSYSPEDPNFIFPENTEINNLLGFRGSYISDLFFQSVGLISYLIPITFFLTGINIFIRKEIFLLIKNTFFIVLYSLIGSLFFSTFYKESFDLYINGNGGFTGNYLNKTFLINIIYFV